MGGYYSPYRASLSCISGSKLWSSGVAARIRAAMSRASFSSLDLIASIMARKITSVSLRMSSPVFATGPLSGESVRNEASPCARQSRGGEG